MPSMRRVPVDPHAPNPMILQAGEKRSLREIYVRTVVYVVLAHLPVSKLFIMLNTALYTL